MRIRLATLYGMPPLPPFLYGVRSCCSPNRMSVCFVCADRCHRGVAFHHDEFAPFARTPTSARITVSRQRGGYHGEARAKEGSVLRAQLREHLRNLDGAATPECEKTIENRDPTGCYHVVSHSVPCRNEPREK